MNDTSEKRFETEVELSLCGPEGPGGVRAPLASYGGDLPPMRRGRSEAYDKRLCLLPDDVVGFLQATQPERWAKLHKQHGDKVRERFLERLRKEVEARGTLDVLRKGVKDLGVGFDLVAFAPETTLNAEHGRLVRANGFTLVRQLRYSERNGNSLDAVIFLNGLPLVTLELKNPLTGQTAADAMRQYKKDRDPKEPLFLFGRCLAHFAVDPDQAFVTTHLRGEGTHFLPFNRGDGNGAGNPLNPEGFKTSYLWEDVLTPASLLELLAHFLLVEDVTDDEGRKTGAKRLLFPRYHQRDAVRRLANHARASGAGTNYLVQHSAGSGKSNSIGWLAHRLTGLHDEANRRVFDTVLVVTDRTVLDRQLRETVRKFEGTEGLVETIERDKSARLAEALEAGKQIITITAQTFPFALGKLNERPDRRYAVIVDEAHSGQSGETGRKMREVLTPASLEEAAEVEAAPPTDEADEVEAAVEAAMRARGRLPNVSFFAFTATPKGKTLELFGQMGPDGKYWPFSLYSMRQAIEEGFILDVLKGYSTLKMFFALQKKVEEDPHYDRKKATYLLRSFVDRSEVAIERKAAIMVAHFHDHVAGKIGGEGKAMVVTRSRLHAVRTKLAIDRLLAERRSPYRALVAFSGEVVDPDSGLPFTEAGMNGVSETQTAARFKRKEFRLMVVAEKFQTGFDEPLLHTMYVDKKLDGVAAVQTLSRLNRTCPPRKTDTFVLDFTNEADDIMASFQPFYTETTLSEGTDPNKLYDLRRLALDFGVFGEADIEEFAGEYFREEGSQAKLQAILDRAVAVFNGQSLEDKTDLRGRVTDFVRLYAFLSQILTFTDADLEKTYAYFRYLAKKLVLPTERLPLEVLEAVGMDSIRIQETGSGDLRLLDETGELHPIGDLGTGKPTEIDKTPLSEIVSHLNEAYGTEFTDEDKLSLFADDMVKRLEVKPALMSGLDPRVNPSEQTRNLSFSHSFEDTFHDMIDANTSIYKKMLEDTTLYAMMQRMVQQQVERRLFGS